MGKTTIKWTNHRDRKRNGKTDTVDASKAKMLIRDGIAVSAESTKAPAKRTAAKPADKPEAKK